MRLSGLLPGSLIAILLPLVPVVLCDITITSPTATQIINAAGGITVTWQDNGVFPLLTDLLKYQILLFSGGNDVPFQVALLQDFTAFAAGVSSAKVTIPNVSAGGTGTNA